MSKASTAALLSNTDRMVQRQAWEMLANENEMRYHTPGWQPGEPVWPEPVKGFAGSYWYNAAGERLHIRPMIEEEDPLAGTYYDMRCEACETSWYGSYECWLCGADTVDNMVWADEIFQELDEDHLCWSFDEETPDTSYLAVAHIPLVVRSSPIQSWFDEFLSTLPRVPEEIIAEQLPDEIPMTLTVPEIDFSRVIISTPRRSGRGQQMRYYLNRPVTEQHWRREE